MKQKKLDKDLIFYSPGEKGVVFTFKAGNFYDDHLVDQTVDHLQYETEIPIRWTEDRRVSPRPV
jgi:hypothetical protein